MPLVDINWNPDVRQLRGFGWIAAMAFAALGVWVYFSQRLLGWPLSPESARTAVWTIAGLAGLCGALTATAPKALKPLYLLLTAITLPIGFALSHLMLAFLFFGILMPMGLVFRLRGRDVLKRKFEPGLKSYWEPRQNVGDLKRYYRQF